MIVQNELVLESANGKHRFKLFVRDDGRLAAVRLFKELDGEWRPRGSDSKVLANIGEDGQVWV